MSTLLEWLKPGARVKRYMIMQIVCIAILIYCIVTLIQTLDLSLGMLIAYILLLTLSAFGIVFSFILAQRNILFISLKNISKKTKNIKVRKLLFGDPRLKKGPKIVVIGGGSGLPNLLKGLKEYTSNITAVVNVSEDDPTISSAFCNNDYLTQGDIRKCITALSTSENEMGKLLVYKNDGNNEFEQSVGNGIISALVNIGGSFTKGIEMIPEISNMQGKIYPVSNGDVVLCAALENGEVVVGKQNIIDRIKELKVPIKQVFLKEGGIKAHPEVIEAIKTANVIVLGPGAFYTSVVSNLLVEQVSKAIVKSRAKKVFVSNIMNQPGQTDGYTLARYVNETERYLGKHVLDYVIVNSGEITDEMIKDFNQEGSSPVKIDLENISNRAICVIKDDIILTGKDMIMHDVDKLSSVIVKLAKSKRVGNLNVVKMKKKKMRTQKIIEIKSILNDTLAKKKSKKNNVNAKTKTVNEKREMRKKAVHQATIEKMKNAIKKG